jgi:hypothetical protein
MIEKQSMSTTKNNTQQSPAPTTSSQPITSGGQTIQRPTSNTSTDRTLKEGSANPVRR